MGKIALKGLEFFAHHGYYDEEQKIGNRYGLDIEVTADIQRAGEKDDLLQTVNYEELYRIAASVMSKKARLLEHIGFGIIQRIREIYPWVDKVEVQVSKFNPPVGGICERSVVTLEG